MIVRSALPGDGPGIAALIGRASPHLDKKGYPASLLPEDMVVLVAEADGAVAGWVEGVLDGVYEGAGSPVPPPHGYVLAVVVDPGWRRRGVGRGLLEGFVARAREAGVEWVFLLPEEGEGARGRVEFFLRCGFTPVDDPGSERLAMGRWTRGAG
ncbi:GNAT family N-acetyltransferase [Nocardiopsis alborubida]|uniref:GNAT family N-acetyltransferase n=1 Tax=Nocardiopsis alborubida TaxID=146802 RepID=A0A7X6MFA5_9ACTN|nr:GNAT family N-acetyltransferase [Nocardiopsis alborubida]NKZ00489.1 GNAT family N-acetyltransferase [Nocardiopsis alborubida]